MLIYLIAILIFGGIGLLYVPEKRSLKFLGGVMILTAMGISLLLYNAIMEAL